MDKNFWRSIQENDYSVPREYSIKEMTEELLSQLGSIDPELRDEITVPILAYWIHRGVYSHEELRELQQRLVQNIKTRLGAAKDDSVFLRTFSILMLAELIHHDNKQPYLEDGEIHQALALALDYLTREKDLRGYVPKKGWAHSVAHTADLLMVLARSRYINAQDLKAIFNTIARKITQPASSVFVCDEDERLVTAAITALDRNLLTLEELKEWLGNLAFPEGRLPWDEWYLDPKASCAYLNTKIFLRSLYWRLMQSETPPEVACQLLPVIEATLKQVSPRY